ncbi:MAG: TonB-dependent receptor [Steroidobacteraceae bacterium]|jgi:iron complex outermembrane receptor protein|nr:TonB-dependent receptor [Steroidobacteraceae bacterium]
MKHTTRTAAAVLATMAGAAGAQSPPPDRDASAAQQLEEITVTARKREESLLDTPLSITAITARDIDRLSITDMREVAALTPGLTISEFGSGTLNQPVIRGLSQLTGGQFAENNVSVFYNGIYIQNNNLVDASFLDIERIEVVKGPVSALYGRNAYAGVINFVTKRATDTPEASVRVIAGDYGRRAVFGSVSGPLGGAFKARLGGRYDATDGTWRDPVTRVNFDGGERRALQAAFEFEPSETFSAVLTAFYADDDLDQPARAFALGNCGAAPGAFQPVICGELPDFDDRTTIRSARPDFDIFGNRRELSLNTLTIEATLGAVEIRSLTSYADTSFAQNRDQDGTGIGFPFTLVGAPAGTVNLTTYTSLGAEDRSFSQELRATFPVGEKLRIGVGGFYNDWSGNTTQTLTVDGRPVPAGRSVNVVFPIAATFDGNRSPFVQTVLLEDEEQSGFTVIDYAATEALSLSLEARRSRQRKRQNQTGSFLRLPAVDPDGPNGIGGSWSFWSYRGSASYRLSPETMVYASAGRGFKAGGFNSGSGIPVADVQYDPEQNDTYELGLKSQWLDGRLQTELTAFYSVLSGIQLFGFSATGLGSVISNGGDATAQGFEALVAARAAPGVTLSVGVAYTDPTFDPGSTLNSSASVAQCRAIPACAGRVGPDAAGRTVLNLGGLALPRQSEWQTTVTADVVRPLTATLDWTLRGVYRYQSKQYTTTPPTNVGWVGDSNRLSLRAGVARDVDWSLEVYVDNALDDGTPLNFGSGLNAANSTFPLAIAYGARRTWGLEFAYAFR